MISVKYLEHRIKERKAMRILSLLAMVFILLPLSACRAEEKKPEQLLSLPFLAVDLNGNGKIDTIPLEESDIYFDVDDDGLAERTEWLAPEDGFIGVISSESRRGRTLLQERMLVTQHERLFDFFVNGMEQLKKFDSDHNNIYDSKDYKKNRNELVPDLKFFIAKDKDLDGIPETRRDQLVSCDFNSFNFETPDWTIQCEDQKVYKVHEKKFEYEDSNVVWKTLCDRLSFGGAAFPNENNNNESQNLCLRQGYVPD